MVTENLQINKVPVSCLQVRNGIYQAVLEYYDENGKRHLPWRSTGLKDLEPIHIQNFYNVLMEEYNLCANTVIHHHALIRKCLDYAFKMNVIVSNPADKVQTPKKVQFINSFYNESELNKLFEISKNDSLELIILITAFYGLRRSEVASLLLAKNIPMKSIQEWLGHAHYFIMRTP